MKIALMHDWLLVNAGSEKVVKELLTLFEQDEVTVYTLFFKLSPQDRASILGKRSVKTSWLQYFPYVERYFKWLLPILPLFSNQLRPGKADLYFTSSHAVAKGFIGSKGITHVCYCHTPMRYAWYQHEDYANDLNWLKRNLLRFVIRFIRQWDLKTAQRVDYFIANSEHIRTQIQQIYHRDARVIYPPVQVEKFSLNTKPRNDFYLAVGRLVSYKKMDVVVQAFLQMPQHKLVLIGDGMEVNEIQRLIAGHSNIVYLGYQHDDELILYMQNAKACIFAAKEDFGITCVEAQSTGTPVLAFNYGGYKETVIEGETGYFFDEQNIGAIKAAVAKFEEAPLTDFTGIRENALRFSATRFRDEIKDYLNEISG